MKKTKYIALLSAVLFFSSSAAIADEDFWSWIGSGTAAGWKGIGVKPVENKQYKEECGSCHFAYQPGLLPAKSWEKLLTPAALHDHFGEVADLDKETLAALVEYVMANSSDKSYYKIARKISKATEEGEPPLRITDTRFIKRKHHEIPEKMVKGNKDVKSLSYCDSCHTKAKEGVFKADTVRIPNYPDY